MAKHTSSYDAYLHRCTCVSVTILQGKTLSMGLMKLLTMLLLADELKNFELHQPHSTVRILWSEPA